MDFIETACIVALLLRKKLRKQRKRKFWVHPILSDREHRGQFYILHEDLRKHPRKFFNYYRMSEKSFLELLKIIGPKISYQNSKWRKCIPPEECLAVTIRYLATGNSFNSLHFEFLLGATTIREIVEDTCNQLWNYLQPLYMPEKSEEDWINIAKEFYDRTNFPNCIGAVDGKHIRLQKPNNTGSEFYNYKNFYSTILLGIVDADYCFTAIDVGAYGAGSDSSVFKNSNFGQRLHNNQLNVPTPQKLPNNEMGEPIPFMIVGDEAFALSQNVLRPYPRRNLTMKQRVFNYRLTRARRMVECTFGILANKWRILHRSLDVRVEFADLIIKTCCILHNFVRKKDGVQMEDEFYECLLQSCPPAGIRPNRVGLNIRDYMANYFTSPEGSVPWQYDKI